jgi:predicted nucleic acid-binding protein
MIVVVDSNVSISALHFASKQGIPTRALEKAVNEDIIATCDEIDVE